MVPVGTASRSAAAMWTGSRRNGDLVRRFHVLVEDVLGDGHKAGMGDPGAVVAEAHFAQFVVADFFESAVVGLRIVLDGHLRGHASHGVDAAAVAGLDEQLDVGVQEVAVHRYLRAVGEDEFGALAEFLDEAENVVPAAAVETGGVIAQLIENFVHLEGGEDGFDENGGADGAARDAE